MDKDEPASLPQADATPLCTRSSQARPPGPPRRGPTPRWGHAISRSPGEKRRAGEVQGPPQDLGPGQMPGRTLHVLLSDRDAARGLRPCLPASPVAAAVPVSGLGPPRSRLPGECQLLAPWQNRARHPSNPWSMIPNVRCSRSLTALQAKEVQNQPRTEKQVQTSEPVFLSWQLGATWTKSSTSL